MAEAYAGHGPRIPEGGMWVEADTNISGGESLIRQFIHGKRFFKEEFGVESQLLWLPDVFGYSGALPQIMRGCGIYKTDMQENVEEKLEHDENEIKLDFRPFEIKTLRFKGNKSLSNPGNILKMGKNK